MEYRQEPHCRARLEWMQYESPPSAQMIPGGGTWAEVLAKVVDEVSPL